MAQLTDFRSDPRITPAQREALRDFAKGIGGDICKLASRLGVDLLFAELPPGEAGYLERSPACGSKSGFRVVVNSLDRETKQRFTVAHELAHFVLHRDDEKLTYREERSHRFASKLEYDHLQKSREFEADRFAVALLMPPGIVKKLATSNRHSARAMSAMCNVSLEAMQRRLMELGFDPQNLGKMSYRQRHSDPYGLMGLGATRSYSKDAHLC